MLVEVLPDALRVTELPAEPEASDSESAAPAVAASPEPAVPSGPWLLEGAELRRAEFSAASAGGRSTLRYGKGGLGCLEVDDPDFRAALAALPRDLRPKGCAERRLGRPVVGALVAGTLGVLLFLWFVAIPVGGDAVGNALPDEYGKAITTSLVDGMLARYPQDDDATGQVADFAAAVGLPGVEDIDFYVVNSSQTNAFAVMGGRIFVHKPILEIPQSSDEFAALLFHEYAHLKLKHTARSTMRSLASYMLISLLLGDASGTAAVLLQNLDTLQNLNYSREFERDADAMAVRMLAERGMDPEAFPRLIERLSAERGAGPELPEVFSTHPDDQARVEAGKALAQSLAGTEPSVPIDAAEAAELWEALGWD